MSIASEIEKDVQSEIEQQDERWTVILRKAVKSGAEIPSAERKELRSICAKRDWLFTKIDEDLAALKADAADAALVGEVEKREKVATDARAELSQVEERRDSTMKLLNQQVAI